MRKTASAVIRRVGLAPTTRGAGRGLVGCKGNKDRVCSLLAFRIAMFFLLGLSLSRCAATSFSMYDRAFDEDPVTMFKRCTSSCSNGRRLPQLTTLPCTGRTKTWMEDWTASKYSSSCQCRSGMKQFLRLVLISCIYARRRNMGWVSDAILAQMWS